MFHQSLFTRFTNDQSGAFAILFGIIAAVLIAFAGAAVDYMRFERDRAEMQTIVDGMTLALHPRIYLDDPEVLQSTAISLLTERMAGRDSNATIANISVDTQSGRLVLNGHLETPMLFLRLIGVETLSAAVRTEAIREHTTVEVAMVLDNSGSMLTDDRIGELKRAVRCATNMIFYGDRAAADCERTQSGDPLRRVKISLIPFTSLVNVGAHNRSASWIDRGNGAPTSRDNFSDRNDPYSFSGAGLNRLDLYDKMGIAWRGCVEARPHLTADGRVATGLNEPALDTSDIPPDPHTPRTLFVPSFAPDAPDFIYANDSENWGRPIPFGASNTTASMHAPGYYNYTMDDPEVCSPASYVNEQCRRSETLNPDGTTTRLFYHLLYDEAPTAAGERVSACDCPGGWTTFTGGASNERICTNATIHNFPEMDGNDRLAISRFYQERLCKYQTAATHASELVSPNADCPEAAILPLSDNPDTVIAAINAMHIRHKTDGTNIHEGTAWGFRTLSPSLPFTEALPYGDGVSKIMIVMTDGENWFVRGNSTPPELMHLSELNGAGRYSAYGYPINNTSLNQRMGQYEATGDWIGNTPFIAEMNQRTLSTCQNAKAMGIEVYMVGLLQGMAPARLAITQDLLRSCATSPSHAYFPSGPSDLINVYREITSRMGALRLAM